MSPDSSGRDTILEVAARLFSEKGYSGVSIRDIAQDCGMTNAALYYHFKNKDDLYLAVMRSGHEKTMESIAQLSELKGDIRAHLKDLVACYVEIMQEQRQTFHNVRRDIKSIDDARAGKLFAEIRNEFMRPIVQVIESAQARGQIIKGDANLFARLLFGMIVGSMFEGRLKQNLQMKSEDIDLLVNVFLDGVSKA
jgi:AcrR family transcriptional regulator